MEPMALGSPVQSPNSSTSNILNTSTFLPPFLMGEQEAQSSTPRYNSLSPTKAGGPRPALFRSPSQELSEQRVRQKLSFAQSPLRTDNQSLPLSKPVPVEKTGPPVQDLFETVDVKYNYTQSDSNRHRQNFPSNYNTQNFSNNAMSLTMDNSFRSPVSSYDMHKNNLFTENVIHQPLNRPLNRNADTWVTVLGFPPSAASMILAYFAQCGNIIEKKAPSQGNWMHLKFSSAFETSKALALNGRIITDTIMVGVLPYKNTESNKENTSAVIDDSIGYNTSSLTSPNRARPLVQTYFSPKQNDVVSPQNVPQKSNGLVTRAMEYVFGW